MEQQAIRQRLEQVRERIAQAAVRAGRRPEQVRLLAVTKAQSAQAIRWAYQAGQRDFAENYVQELVSKAAQLADLTELRWHFIGHLQSNKAKRITELVQMVHTVDSASLAEELGKRAKQVQRRMPVLVEVNIGQEASKSGVEEQTAKEVCESVRAQDSLQLVGLMTVPPYELQAEQTRAYFAKLRTLSEQLGPGPWELSMGMSHDFEQAIEEGATMVRVGTAIFGARANKD